MAAGVQTLAERAEALAGLHRGPRPLLLPNAWDAASARVLEEAGFPAIATSSSAVASSLGHADGEAAPAAEMLAAVARVAGAVSVPVTADLEAGYGLPAAELVERLLEAGAVGCNLEDTDHRAGGLVDPERQAERLAEVRAAADAAGVGVVVNARVDVFRHRGATARLARSSRSDGRGLPLEPPGPTRPAGPPGELLGEALHRARRYLEAGADCVYPILLRDEQAIAELVGGAGGPVNVLYQPGAPSLERLAELGVARVSFAGGLHRATMGLLRRLADRILANQDPYRR